VIARYFSLIVYIAAAGCASRSAQPAAPVADSTLQTHTHHHSDLPATAGPGYTVADVRFMQNMIGHHAQALRMVELTGDRGASVEVRTLALKIDISQKDEIAMMKKWLSERGQAVPTDEQANAMMMVGMLTGAEIAQLARARGAEFDRLFLRFMIRHHEGALQMVDELMRSPGAGQESEIFRFATDVDADQRDEIFVMQRLLDTLR
jgi:uncharacterized protein (DUF305 family)